MENARSSSVQYDIKTMAVRATFKVKHMVTPFYVLHEVYNSENQSQLGRLETENIEWMSTNQD